MEDGDCGIRADVPVDDGDSVAVATAMSSPPSPRACPVSCLSQRMVAARVISALK